MSSDIKPMDQLKDAGAGALKALGSKITSSIGDRVGSLTDHLDSVADGGPLKKAAVEGAEAKAKGDSAVMGGLKGAVSGVKDKITGGGGKDSGGGKATDSTNIVESIDVGVPLRVAYNQWTEFGSFPSFMKKVESVEAADDNKLVFKAQIFWSHRTWEATIKEQIPDERIVWKSKGKKGHVDGAVTFHELGPELTRILVVLEYYPQGLFEKTGNIWEAQGRRARAELRHFRRHVMTRSVLHPDDIEGWRGTIEDGEVVETHEDALEREEQEQQEQDEQGYEDGEGGEESSEDEYDEGEPEDEADSDEDDYEDEPDDGEEEPEDEYEEEAEEEPAEDEEGDTEEEDPAEDEYDEEAEDQYEEGDADEEEPEDEYEEEADEEPAAFALVGGVWLMYLLGYNMSVAVAVGFIALAGVAAETGVVMLIYLDHAWEAIVAKRKSAGEKLSAADLYAAVMEGAVERVRPKMMTVVAIMAGLLPIMWGSGTGSEVMRPIAAPMVGGMISSTILTLIVIPAIYAVVKEGALRNTANPLATSVAGIDAKTPPEVPAA